MGCVRLQVFRGFFFEAAHWNSVFGFLRALWGFLLVLPHRRGTEVSEVFIFKGLLAAEVGSSGPPPPEWGVVIGSALSSTQRSGKEDKTLALS